MTLTADQTLIIVLMVTLGTMLTRFLPFILLRRLKDGRASAYIAYLGRALPYAAIGLLVVYCLKSVNLAAPAYGLPEAIAIICVVALQWWKDNALLSIGAGTLIYMVLVQAVFI